MLTIKLPYDEEALLSLVAGEEVLLSGRLHVGRDQVHKRLYDTIQAGGGLPFDFNGAGIYYMGPSPAPEGLPIGSAGPTTSARMDPYSPCLMEHGLRLMIGKGPRSQAVMEAIRRCKAVYLQAYGGCGALYAQCVKSCKVIAYPELGPEALLELEVVDMPLFCMIDAHGGIYQRPSI